MQTIGTEEQLMLFSFPYTRKAMEFSLVFPTAVISAEELNLPVFQKSENNVTAFKGVVTLC